MPAKKAKSFNRTLKRRKPTPGRGSDILKLVRAGVIRFILQDAPIGDFQKTIREASKTRTISSHPLSGVEFRRIVKEAMKQRRQNLARRQGRQ